MTKYGNKNRRKKKKKKGKVQREMNSDALAQKAIKPLHKIFKLNSEVPGRQGKQGKLGKKQTISSREATFFWHHVLYNISHMRTYFCKRIQMEFDPNNIFTEDAKVHLIWLFPRATLIS